MYKNNMYKPNSFIRKKTLILKLFGNLKARVSEKKVLFL